MIAKKVIIGFLSGIVAIWFEGHIMTGQSLAIAFTSLAIYATTCICHGYTGIPHTGTCTLRENSTSHIAQYHFSSVQPTIQKCN